MCPSHGEFTATLCMYARDAPIGPIQFDRPTPRRDATRAMVGVVAAARAPDGLLCEIMCV